MEIAEHINKLMMQEKENPWIMSEKQMFGRDGIYSFDA